jgi:hypothetical protein
VANFRTHFSVAAGVSGVSATSLMVVQMANHTEVLLYFSMGVIGGFLPDIDHDNSVPLQIALHVCSLLVAFMVMFSKAGQLSVVELLLLWAMVYVLARVLLFFVITRLTVHRGILHSVPAALLAGLTVTAITHYVLSISLPVAWFCGLFLASGYLVHLLLDELYSVDVYGRGFKRSFGTAFKFYNPRDWRSTIFVYVLLLGVVMVMPMDRQWVNAMTSPQVYQSISQRFWPGAGGWFQYL